MASKEEKPSNEMQGYVMYLRYKLAQYQFYGIVPPAKFLIELKMAERLAKLDSNNSSRIDVKV